MSHERKKGKHRKDHKVHTMKEGVAERKAEFEAKAEHPTTDQNDIQTFKPGAADDHSRNVPPPSKD